MTELNAQELGLFLQNKTLIELPIDIKKLFFLISKKLTGLIIRLSGKSPKHLQTTITLYLNALCLHLSQTNNYKLSLFLAEKAIAIFEDVLSTSDASDAVSSCAEKILIGNIQWSYYIVYITRASRMIAYLLCFLYVPGDKEEDLTNLCSIICHSIWKFAEHNEIDDLLILIDGLSSSYSNREELSNIIRIALTLNKPIGVIDVYSDTIGLTVKPMLLKIR